MSEHAEFSAALINPAANCPPGLVSWNGSDPAQRFAVYRNNVLASLLGALADTYPVCQAMVGAAFFNAMASQYVRAVPPVSPVLVNYGESFADFVENFAPAASVPYLADLARLEWCYVQAFHAADAAAVPLTELAGLLGDERRLAQLCFTLQPSLSVLRSSFAVASLWAAHQTAEPAAVLHSINPQQPESAVLLRQDLAVHVVRLEEGAAHFIENLAQGRSFAEAVSNATPFNLAAALEVLLRAAAITDYRVQE
ncbi:HvfC/BufC N-terminal domain-containing protein [Pseudomonas sp. N040]|uniref:HvfC/BufC N-terminal domain-containing protein n=1 Tax=Pseudomonas sp. N040 TaxID=2785325 RepID=UPI0018A2864B|nr:DNA-binding domain-containing protein [Pseudomonas sp. N040]MBF7729674.1 putative DNA-binding domain-containing protein [Pseudomonas sp. N040]MBW7013316.1 DNA-binding domain-containing protein [Pseudomonas sp. N040]